MNEGHSITFEEIQKVAFELGWDDVAATDPSIPKEDQLAYEAWLEKKYQGKLKYMENKVRCHPKELFPSAKTAILFVSYYKQPKYPFVPNKGLVASYARGRDYHHVHRKRLKKFISWLENRVGQTGIAKGFSDSSPILEKALAVKAGLGWFGKNTLLIHRKFGTFILLSGLLTSVEITYPAPILTPTRLPRCGQCTRCLDACPTQAIISPYLLDANRCLSYHLIESKDPLPNHIKENNPGYIFGCDICQDVCPHNQRKEDSLHPEFMEENGIGPYLSLENIESIEQNPETLFGTPLQRRKAQGLRYNFDFIG